MAKKKSVLFYLDNYTPSIKALSYEQKGMLFDAIISYAGGIADEPANMGLLSLALDGITAAINRDNDKYLQVCERNRKNGRKGGKPKQTQTNPVGSNGLSSEPTLTQVNPNKPDTDTDTDTDTIQIVTQIQEEQEPVPDKPDEPPKKPRKKFIPPTIIEVATYCTERNNTVNPEAFVDHYTSNGWKVGKNSMKSWQAAVRTWEKNSFGKGNQNGKRPQQKTFGSDYHPESSAGKPNNLF